MSYLFEQIQKRNGKTVQKEINKVIMMGLQEAGKTAIKDVIFQGKTQKEVQNYMATTHYKREFLDEKKEHIWIDSGGQESYWNEAVTYYRHVIFNKARVLIWVTDISRPDLFVESERRFSFTIRQFKKINPEGKVYVFAHKIDLVDSKTLERLFSFLKETLDDPKYTINFFKTSIKHKNKLIKTIKTIFSENNISLHKFELFTNINEKEDQEYLINYSKEMDEQEAKIKELYSFINPQPKSSMPTYGNIPLKEELHEHNFLEITLLERDNLAPAMGVTSSPTSGIEQGIEYVLALQKFIQQINKEHKKLFEEKKIVQKLTENIYGMAYYVNEQFLLLITIEELLDQKSEKVDRLVSKFLKEINIDEEDDLN